HKTTDKIRDRRERIAAIATGKPRKLAAHKTANKIRDRRERISTIATGKAREPATQKAADEIRDRRERIAAVTAGKTRDRAFRNRAAQRTVIAAREKSRYRTGFAEQHARQILPQQILAKAAFTGDAKRRKLAGNHAERKIFFHR